MKGIRWIDALTMNIYWLGLTTISQTNGLVVPLLVQRFFGPEQQGTAYGRLRLYTLMVALLAQALMGMLSDRSTLRWGRRRPYILVGTLLNIICVLAIGASPTYLFLFAAAVASQIVSNVAHAGQQGLIPDLVPEDRRGRFSGVKAIMELLPVILVGLTIGPMISKGNMWGGLILAVAILFVSMALTMLVREEPLSRAPIALDWKPFGRLVGMTAAFLLIILGTGEVVQRIGGLFGADTPAATLVVVMGVVGLAAMVLAVVVGVWVSVRISIGAEEMNRHPSFSWWVVNRLAFLVGTTNLSGFGIYFLQSRLGFEGEAAAGPISQLMMVVGVMILILALPSGWLADRIGRKRLVALSGIVAAAGAAVIVAASTLPVMFIGGALIGMATGTFFTTNWALGTDLVPKDKAGRYLGISNLAGAGAGAVGGYIGGPIADHLTARVPQTPGVGYMLIFAIYGVLFLVSALVLRAVREDWQSTAEHTPAAPAA
ncbi:MAG: MFS transporter [Anaerolineales bacterium]|nr:MFS transporter [Anaerolineales bacterium]